MAQKNDEEMDSIVDVNSNSELATTDFVQNWDTDDVKSHVSVDRQKFEEYGDALNGTYYESKRTLINLAYQADVSRGFSNKRLAQGRT